MAWLSATKQWFNSSTTIISHYFQREIYYRVSIITFRIGDLLEMYFLVAFWMASYAKGSTLDGMTLDEMLTYLLIGNLVQSLTKSWSQTNIAVDITTGSLSQYLIKPMHYLNFAWARTLGRTMLIWVSGAIIFFIAAIPFWSKLVYPKNISLFFIVILMIFLANITETLFGMCIGLASFWMEDSYGLNLTLDRIKKFLSGGYFPLTVFTSGIVSVGLALPFAYTFFVPMQLYLGKMSIQDGLRGVGIQISWIIGFLILLSILWKRGIKTYEAVGN